jgi:ankyrin repeat protein
MRRREESFASLVFAAKQGDLDVVRMMLAGGMELHRDYDGRTVLAHAATAGVYKVCDVLLEEKADVNAVNRWGQTPLDEAVAANQGSIIQLLLQRHARMGSRNMATALIEAASNGESEVLARILHENQTDRDARDYDGRTPLHLACANGHMKAAELLLGCKAAVNAEDRWGGTPLEDAIASGHSAIAYLLWGKGGRMNREAGITKLCEAAGRGNMVALRMLRTCRVVDLDSKDYDGRTALAVAASEGRVLATSYLLSCSCSPDELDGWGASALDRALQGGTLFHMYCAKLIQSWGGQISALKGTHEGEQALRELDFIDIGDVRMKLKSLIAQGHDQAIPKAMTEYEIRLAFESCMSLIPLAQKVRCGLEDACCSCNYTVDIIQETAHLLVSLARPVCELLDSHPFLQKRKSCLNHQNDVSSFKLSSALLLLQQSAPVGSSAFCHERRKHVFLVQKLKKTISNALEDGNIDEFEENQIREAWDSLEAVDQEMLFEEVDELDSDEEAQLHAEVDVMIAEREYCEAHGLERTLYQVSKFQSTAMRIGEIEEMYDSLCAIFWAIRAEPADEVKSCLLGSEVREPYVSVKDIISFFAALGSHSSQDIPHYEVEEMFEEARAWITEIVNLPDDKQSRLSHLLPSTDDNGVHVGKFWSEYSTSPLLPLRSVVAGSTMFRQALLTAPLDEVWCLLKRTTGISELIPETLLQVLITGGSVINAYKGQVLFRNEGNVLLSRTHENGEKGSNWFVIIAGCLSITFRSSSDDPEAPDGSNCAVLSAGQLFGGYIFLGGTLNLACTIKARSACKLVQLPLVHLKALRTDHQSIADALKGSMAEGYEIANMRNVTPNQQPKPLTFLRHQTSKVSSYRSNTAEAILASHLAPGSASPATLHAQVRCDSSGKVHSESSTKSDISSRLSPTTFSRRGATLTTLGGRTQWWGDTQASYIAKVTGRGNISYFYAIQCGLKYIEEAWQYLSGGSSYVEKQTLCSIWAEAGEIGSGTFVKLFLSSHEEYAAVGDMDSFLHDLKPSEFWGLWIALLADKRLKEAGPRSHLSSVVDDKAFNGLGSTNPNAACDKVDLDCSGSDSEVYSDNFVNASCLESLHSRIALSRRLSKSFLSADLISSGRYEQVYLWVVGDLNSPLQSKDIPEFIRRLLPDYQYRISKFNCEEFIKTFSKSSNSNEICWPDIRRVLRVKTPEERRKMFIRGRLHPQSRISAVIKNLGKVLALYHFFSIPWRLCFADPSQRMLDELNLWLFLPADTLTALYVIAKLNTAHQSANRNCWVVNRWKIYRKVGNSCIVSALPIDWVIYAVGGSYQVCLWFRSFKLLFCCHAFFRSTGVEMYPKHLILVFQSVAVMHVCCCFWYFIGVQYQYWDDTNPFSWFKLGYPINDPRYIPDSPDVGTGYAYHALQCSELKTAACNPEESWYYYGMWYSDSEAAKYLLSFWIVCSRVSNQGLIGNIVPQNFAEVAYSIMLVMLNLTVFRYVIGEMSASVMNFNEQLVTARNRAEKVENFIKTNRLPEDLVNEIKVYCSSSSSANASVSKYSRILRFLPHTLQASNNPSTIQT